MKKMPITVDPNTGLRYDVPSSFVPIGQAPGRDEEQSLHWSESSTPSTPSTSPSSWPSPPSGHPSPYYSVSSLGSSSSGRYTRPPPPPYYAHEPPHSDGRVACLPPYAVPSTQPSHHRGPVKTLSYQGADVHHPTMADHYGSYRSQGNQHPPQPRHAHLHHAPAYHHPQHPVSSQPGYSADHSAPSFDSNPPQAYQRPPQSGYLAHQRHSPSNNHPQSPLPGEHSGNPTQQLAPLATLSAQPHPYFPQGTASVPLPDEFPHTEHNGGYDATTTSPTGGFSIQDPLPALNDINTGTVSDSSVREPERAVGHQEPIPSGERGATAPQGPKAPVLATVVPGSTLTRVSPDHQSKVGDRDDRKQPASVEDLLAQWHIVIRRADELQGEVAQAARRQKADTAAAQQEQKEDIESQGRRQGTGASVASPAVPPSSAFSTASFSPRGRPASPSPAPLPPASKRPNPSAEPEEEAKKKRSRR